MVILSKIGSHLQAIDCLIGIMRPVHPPEVFFKKRLNTNAEAVNAHFFQAVSFCSLMSSGLV